MTREPMVPSPDEARRLADLVADARAIPAAAFLACDCVERAVAVPPASLTVRIPEATVSLVEAAAHHWADFSR